jgi:hypothetical protein
MSVRITAAGAVAVALICYSTAPVSACDERYVKRCEKISAAAAMREEAQTGAPAVRRKSAARVRMVFSVRSRHGRLVRRMQAPRFTVAKAERGMTLASDSTRMTTLMPESALARRFRGFIDPLPMAQNAFESLRKPHLVALNLEPTPAMAANEPVAAGPDKPDTPQPAVSAAALAKQDRIAVKPPVVEAIVEKPAALVEAQPAKPVAVAQANVVPPVAVAQPAPQAVLTEAPAPAPADDQPSPFSVHKLVLALCGALGAAGALRFIVGA